MHSTEKVFLFGDGDHVVLRVAGNYAEVVARCAMGPAYLRAECGQSIYVLLMIQGDAAGCFYDRTSGKLVGDSYTSDT